jgi:nitrite reductase (NADH) small subunit
LDSPDPTAPFLEVLEEAALPPGRMEMLEIRDRKIVLINRSGRIHALDNTCPHLGGSLGRGTLEDNCIICPLHHWSFDLETGKVVVGVPDERVATYPVKVEKGRISIQLA